MNNHKMGIALIVAGLATVSTSASAHVSISSGVGFADKNQIVTFSVGHGCSGMDTYSLRVEIPGEVTSLRLVDTNLGPATIEYDAAQLITAITWTKADSEIRDQDDSYYFARLRIRVPDMPMSTLYFPATQTCRDNNGNSEVVDWVSTDPTSEAEPAAALLIVPDRLPGWNKYTVSAAIDDLSSYFGDAQIVWKEKAAFSANPSTTELIGGTPGVTALSALAAGDTIWVRY